MTKQKEVMETWTTLKQNLMTTIQVLKTNHKDNWAVVKAKSTPHQLVLDSSKITKLQQKISRNNQQIQELDRRSSKELLSPTDQVHYQQLAAEVEAWEKEILEKKQELANFATQLNPRDNFADYLARLRKEKEYDSLQEKLAKVIRLVADNQLEELKTLYQNGDLNI